VDGWVSLEVSPLLAHNTTGTLAAARALHNRAARPNLFIKIPGTSEGLPAIEEAIFAGIPVNVTLLFSGEQYVAAAEAYMRGIERRIGCRAQSRCWFRGVTLCQPLGRSCRPEGAGDSAQPAWHRHRQGCLWEMYRTLLDSPRWQRIQNAGARPQRLLWASTGTKDPNASNILYVQALALPSTINTMPEATLNALAAHAEFGEAPPEKNDKILTEFAIAGIDTEAVAAQLLGEGVASFAKSWNDLLDCIASKSAALKAVVA
jgi:transaldolase